jgi:acyl-CoA reductase-like NAD-dependent aldehyde dehydrogenase
MVIKDDGEIFSCDLTPHGKQRKIFTTREPLLGAISAITLFNHPLNMVSHKIAPAIATNNCVVVKPTELTPMTALCWPTFSTRPACRPKCCRWSPAGLQISATR